jgi:hypothetical protein
MRLCTDHIVDEVITFSSISFLKILNVKRPQLSRQMTYSSIRLLPPKQASIWAKRILLTPGE